MEDGMSSEETTFVVDDVSNVIKEAIEGAIGGSTYQHSKVQPWTNNVVEQCLNQLSKLGKPFKYIVTCVIMQKNGAGLHTASSCFWDNVTDGQFLIVDPHDQHFSPAKLNINRKLHSQMGEQNNVLHCQCFWSCHLTMRIPKMYGISQASLTLTARVRLAKSS